MIQTLKLIGNLLLTGLIVLVFLIAWGSTVFGVYNSARARRLSFGERVFWIALAIVLPFVGAFIYLLARVSGVLVSPQQPEPAGRRESTEVMDGGFYGPYPSPASMPAQPPPWQPVRDSRASGGRVTPPAGYPATNGGAQRSAGPRLHLRVAEGPCAGSNFMIERLPALIGRGLEASVRLDDDHLVSRHHAEIFLRDGDLFLRDLDSLHGTKLNGAPLGEAPLTAGDTILVGDSLIHVD